MKWTIPQILKIANTTIEFEEWLDFSEVVKQHKQLRDLSRVHVYGTGRVEGNSKIHFNINITGEMTLGCAVTLEDVVVPFNISDDEIFVLNDKVESDEYLKPFGQTIDLTPVVWAMILLEIPIRVVSDKAKKLPGKGKGWQVISNDEYNQKIDELQKEKDIDPRLSKLLEIIDD